MATREHLRKSARNKLSAAERLTEGHCNLPVEVTYLCVVALECSLKHAILSRNGFQRTEEICDKSHQLYDYFHGTGGHDLDKLRRTARRKFTASRSWTRMKNPVRPYSLRYSSEEVAVAECKEDLSFTRDVVASLEDER
jgi:hypothetical protein